MPKTTYLKVRLEADDMLTLERQSRTLNMPKSRLARLLLTGGAAVPPQPQEPAAAAPVFDDSRLAAVEGRLDGIEESLSASARAFDNLLSQLAEFLRIPSFREYRARLGADGVAQRQNEDDTAYLLRAASRYFVLYQSWPDPSDSRSFGPAPQGFEAARFPKQPPG